MWQTKNIYIAYHHKGVEPEPQFRDRYPSWTSIDRLSDKWMVRGGFIVLYISFYIVFATHWWMFLLLPFHFLMGPLHGAIVNWCAHKYGYTNYDNGDKSRNTFPMDFLMMGELFQNNHHQSPNSPNFAKRWFELDPTYPLMRLFQFAGIIKLRKSGVPTP